MDVVPNSYFCPGPAPHTYSVPYSCVTPTKSWKVNTKFLTLPQNNEFCFSPFTLSNSIPVAPFVDPPRDPPLTEVVFAFQASHHWRLQHEEVRCTPQKVPEAEMFARYFASYSCLIFIARNLYCSSWVSAMLCRYTELLYPSLTIHLRCCAERSCLLYLEPLCSLFRN